MQANLQQLNESTPKQEADAIMMPDSAIAVVHEKSNNWQSSFRPWFRAAAQDEFAITRHQCFCYAKLVLMVMGRRDACVKTCYCSNDGAQNDQEELNRFSSTLRAFSPIVVSREDRRQAAAPHVVKKDTRLRNGCSMWISEVRSRRFPHVRQSQTGLSFMAASRESLLLNERETNALCALTTKGLILQR